MPDVESTRGVYGITTVAELVGIEAQSLRLYERRGLLEPARTSGGTAATARTTSIGSVGSVNSSTPVSTSQASPSSST